MSIETTDLGETRADQNGEFLTSEVSRCVCVFPFRTRQTSDMTKPICIDIEPTIIRGERGQRFRVHFHGAVLIDETSNPEFEASRVLMARGVVGRLEVWRYC